MTTTRDVILRIKTELQGARGGPASGFAAMSREVKRAESDIDKARRGVKGMTDDLARMERQAKRTGDALKFGNGRISGIAGIGGQAGGQGGGMFGGMGGSMGKMAGFAPLAMFASMIGSTIKDIGLAKYAASAGGGGPLMKGSGGWLEKGWDFIHGTDYRNRNEDWFERRTQIESQYRQTRWAATMEGQQARYDAERSLMPIGATHRERLEMLRGQNRWNIAGAEAQGSDLAAEQHLYQRQTDALRAKYKKYGLDMDSSDITKLVSSSGLKMSKQNELEGERKALLTKQLELQTHVNENLKQQQDLTRATVGNLKEQQATIREMTMARKSSLTSYGMLDPFQQQAAVGVAVAAKEGRPLTPEQRALGMQVPEIADFLQRQAASRAVDDPNYQRILQLVGRPGDAEQFARSKSAADKIQLQPGQMKIEAFLQVDEQLLGDAIAKGLGPAIMDKLTRLEVLAKQMGEEQKKADLLQERRRRDRESAGGNSGGMP